MCRNSYARAARRGDGVMWMHGHRRRCGRGRRQRRPAAGYYAERGAIMSHVVHVHVHVTVSGSVSGSATIPSAVCVEASGGSGTDSSLADVVPTLRSASSAFLQRWGRCVYQTCCDVSGARSSGVRVGVQCVRLVCLSCVLRAVRQAASTSSVPRGL